MPRGRIGSARRWIIAAAAIVLAITFQRTASNAAASGTLRGTALDDKGVVLWDAYVFVSRSVDPDVVKLVADTFPTRKRPQ